MIEMLIVLSILAVATGATMLGFGALDRGARAEDEAMRLADRLQLASDRALVSGTPMLLVWDARGYRLLRWDVATRAWQEPDESSLFEAHRLPGALRLEVASAAQAQAIVIAPDQGRSGGRLIVRGGLVPWTVVFDGMSSAATSGVLPNG